MKRIIFILFSVFFLYSCQQEDSIFDPVKENEPALSLKNTQTLGYENSVPVWRYYCYNNAYYSDHYYTLQRPTPEVGGTYANFEGKQYIYEGQDFNIMTQYSPGNTVPLYVYQSVGMPVKQHCFSTSGASRIYGGYNGKICYEKKYLLGYIFSRQYPGTIPMTERIYLPANDFVYNVLGNNTVGEDAIETSIIGYVYPGKRNEFPGKKWEAFTFNLPANSTKTFPLTISIRIREQIRPNAPITYKTLVYQKTLSSMNRQVLIELAGAYTVQSAQLVINHQCTNTLFTIPNILDPNNFGNVMNPDILDIADGNQFIRVERSFDNSYPYGKKYLFNIFCATWNPILPGLAEPSEPIFKAN